MRSSRAPSFTVLLFCLALSLGCGSVPPGGGSAREPFASTTIELIPRYNVEQATLTMFRTEGFQLTDGRSNHFTFQRAGDPYMQDVYGESFGPGVQVKAEVLVWEREFGLNQVHCDVYLLSPGADGWLPAREGRAEFRGLLKKIKKLAGVL